MDVLTTEAFKGLEIKNQKAFQQFEKCGIPDKTWERWQYTDISKKYPAPKKIALENNTEVKVDEVPFTHQVVFLNGHLQNSNLPEGVSLEECSIDSWDQENPMDCLNASFCEKSYKLNVKRNTVVKDPIILIQTYSSQSEEMGLSRLQIHVEAFAELSLVEYSISSAGREFVVNNSVRVRSDENSVVHFTQIQNFDVKIKSLGQLKIEVGKNALFYSTTVNLGADTNRQNILAELNDFGATAHLNGVFALTGSQHNDVYTQIHHNRPNTYSHQLYKGILDQESRGVFAGMIYVPKDSQKINSEQLSKNILLSKKARIHTLPMLEIYADDVKCAHGATVGQLSEDEIFYLTSRGIKEEKAKKLLCQGFGIEALEEIKGAELRKWVTDIVLKKLEQEDFGHF